MEEWSLMLISKSRTSRVQIDSVDHSAQADATWFPPHPRQRGALEAVQKLVGVLAETANRVPLPMFLNRCGRLSSI